MTTAAPTPSSTYLSLPEIPSFLRKIIAPFPLIAYPAALPPHKQRVTEPTLWIHPPLDQKDLLSSDVECLKWQTHLALRGLKNIGVRWDIVAEGALGGRLPNLQIPSLLAGDGDGELLAVHNIPTWILERVGEQGELDGYKDVLHRDESLAWVALLEGDVHAALILAQPLPSFFRQTILQLPPSQNAQSLESLLTPPPAPSSGITSFIPPFGSRIPVQAIRARYREAIASLGERLGTDKWFLGSQEPTALDALAFAYLHILLNSSDDLRIEVARRVNLVSWEKRVYELVRGAFVSHYEHAW
ncbi:hypothetical protein OF83DRAFT_1175468 [Amylostereum chailletii]|nr:hypothetical protein OF83DRAFT_1175468 [Amylostereum chailletii]